MRRVAAVLALTLASLFPAAPAGAETCDHWQQWSPNTGLLYDLWHCRMDYGGAHFSAAFPAYDYGVAGEIWSDPGLITWYDPASYQYFVCEPAASPWRWLYLHSAWSPSPGSLQAYHAHIDNGAVMSWASWNQAYAWVTPWSGDPPTQCLVLHLW